ncbi:MAG: type IV pilus assembly protein FimV [Halomonadaceae bacterium]
MGKTLTWMTWLSLSALSPITLAVGLGQASVSSYLNAPLDASIPLLESSDYALDSIRVGIADPSDFATAGLEWTPLAANVRAQVVEYQGQRQVRLSSRQAMQDPWLDLLLAVEFPGGQQFRDITLLFDPQGYSQNQAQVQSAAPPPSAYVGRGDTLWGVAERVKPAGVSVQQMMVALLEANSSVFPSGNIHAMRAGQTLSVPDTERVLARSNADADATIQAMTEAWRARRNGELQPVPLPDVETAPITDIAIAAAQALPANDVAVPGNALAADGAEADEPEVVEAASGEGSSENSQDEQEVSQPEALTRAELTEQLRLSQATLQQVLEERELIRAELNQLRDALAAPERPLTPRAASMSATDSQGTSGLIARYQWPLALAAIALLVALLVWLRKRREETWETESFADPIIRATVSPSATPSFGINTDPNEITKVETTKVEVKDVEAQDLNEEKAQAVKASIAETQADELAEQERQLGLHAVAQPDDSRFIDYYPPTLTSSMSANAQPRAETPMQPSVEFATRHDTTPSMPAKKPRPPIEEEWEIEEVAFKPQGLDNSNPSKSAK